MAPLLHYLLVLLSFSSLVLASPPPQANFKPNKLVLQVHKDSATNLHVANVHSPHPSFASSISCELTREILVG